MVMFSNPVLKLVFEGLSNISNNNESNISKTFQVPLAILRRYGLQGYRKD